MRLATVQERSHLVSPDGRRVVDLVKIGDGRFDPDPRRVFDRWEELRSYVADIDVDFDALGVDVRTSELQAPSPDPRQVFAIGLNYRDHADESGLDYPESPVVFTKFLTSFAGPDTTLVLPSQTVDWEAELVVVIGRRAERVEAADSWSYVAGLTVGQDYSDRALQLAGPAPQFSFGKSWPGFSPQGPWLVTVDELDDPDDLAISCTINGESVQNSRTAQLIFPVAELVAQLSAVTPLLPGDVIFTGTPAGVGGGRKPPRFLAPGDVVETTIEGLGSLCQTCITEPAPA